MPMLIKLPIYIYSENCLFNLVLRLLITVSRGNMVIWPILLYVSKKGDWSGWIGDTPFFQCLWKMFALTTQPDGTTNSAIGNCKWNRNIYWRIFLVIMSQQIDQKKMDSRFRRLKGKKNFFEESISFFLMILKGLFSMYSS